MSLLGHLGELRTRLFKVIVAVLVLGFLSLAFAKELFHFLVVPILQALPEGERTLVQTSAVEELNTFIKVGLYAGLFFSMPVVLHQIWGFVAPGLFAHERRMAVPFIGAGTACFLAGVSFCYFVVLPPAFQFLLRPEGLQERQVELSLAEGAVEDAGLLLRAGDYPAATRLLGEAAPILGAAASSSSQQRTLLERIDRLQPVLDAADRAVAQTGGGREPLSQAVLARNEARRLALEGAVPKGEEALQRSVDHAARSLSLAVGGETGTQAAALAVRHAEVSAQIASVGERLALDDWTRPMLSMREQLNLVLLLLMAFGIIFEIPVVFALLAAVGVIDGTELAKARRYAIVANVVLAAVITPTGDPFNLALMALPMILCYEIGLVAARLIAKRRKAREAQALIA